MELSLEVSPLCQKVLLLKYRLLVLICIFLKIDVFHGKILFQIYNSIVLAYIMLNKLRNVCVQFGMVFKLGSVGRPSFCSCKAKKLKNGTSSFACFACFERVFLNFKCNLNSGYNLLLNNWIILPFSPLFSHFFVRSLFEI